QKSLSLNEAKRKQEKQDIDDKRLAMENRRRAAKGQALLKTWREAEDKAEEEADNPDPNKEKPEDEAFAMEAGRILLDSLNAQVSKR
ncbi:MAG TPA: carboxy terminal-processing peptidase, partial [Moraxellaceae bacterium]